MNDLLQQLRQDYPNLTFTQGNHFSWSSAKNQITYTSDTEASDTWNLLHELGHGILVHSEYTNDVDLLMKEVAAWEQARKLALLYNIAIDDEHMQDCLDSYRDWIFKRSSCPECRVQGIQKSSEQYMCLNCKHTWRVTKSRLCRPYRRSR